MRATLLPQNSNLLKKIIFQSRNKLQLKTRTIRVLKNKLQNQNKETKILGNKIEAKESMIGELENKIKSREREIESCKEIIQLLQRKKYAPSSEAISSKQLSLFNELEDVFEKDDKGEEEGEKEVITYERRKPGSRKPRIPDSLPREERVIELEGKDRTCPHDGTEMEEIGEETSEKLEITPAKVKVIKTIRKKYACKCCRKNIETAPLPPSILPKTMASPSLISCIIINKYGDALPLYRQEKIFDRIGAGITRQTMARWLIEVSQDLMPLYNLLEEKMLSSSYIQMDETTVQVLKESGKKATTKSYMWVRYLPGSCPIVLFDYDPTRKKEVPQRLGGV